MSFEEIRNNTDRSFVLISASQNIIDCNKNIGVLKEHYARLGLSFPVHSYANFRDGFIHYEKLYSTLLNVESACQKYAFDEHLQRCTKDACVFVLHTYLEILTNILTSNTLDEKKDLAFLNHRKQVEDYCDFIFDDFYQLKDDLSFWTIKNLDNICVYLTNCFFDNNDLGINDNEYSRKCYRDYIKCCLLAYYKENGFKWFKGEKIKEVRSLVHRMDNYILDIRSEASNLVKTYQRQDDDKFLEFVKISNDAYDFLRKNFLLGIVFFLV